MLTIRDLEVRAGARLVIENASWISRSTACARMKSIIPDFSGPADMTS